LKLEQELGGDVLLISGLSIWPSARPLAEHVLRRDVRGLRVLELGAGTGAVGLACGIGGASRVVLSDRLVLQRPKPNPAAEGQAHAALKFGRRQLELLERNLALNAPLFAEGCDSKVVELDFDAEPDSPSSVDAVMNEHGPFDLVLGSDIAYSSQAHPALARCLAQLYASHRQMSTAVSQEAPLEVLLGHQSRLPGSLASLKANMAREQLTVTEVHKEGEVVVLRIDSQQT
ncbi:unnamed protein product, partial [Polarella glacialis]